MQAQSNNESTAANTPGRVAGPSGAMPPPPAPAAQSVMLEREARALSSCFKNAVIKTGQIYSFHADARRLGIHKYASHPPRTLMASLGRELEQYDQICDVIESQLSCAISVLKRDLTREERRAREAEQAALAARAPKVPAPSVEAGDATPGQSSPQGPTASISMRRPSAISLSSLNRGVLPPKLDLSSSSMRISAEEVALFPKGLVPSPVSLAPKSARPTATADIDLMAAFASAAAANSGSQRVDIDLTEPESPPTMMTGIDPSLGNTADKPIELDLDSIDMEMSDMTNLFGDGPDSTSRDDQAAVDSLFSPETADSGAPLSANEVRKGESTNDDIDMDILGALHAEHGGQGENLFGPVAGGSGNGSNRPHSGSSTIPPPSLVPGFIQSGMQGSVGGFDLSTLDLSSLPNFDPAWQNMNFTDMEALFSTGSNQEGQKS